MGAARELGGHDVGEVAGNERAGVGQADEFGFSIGAGLNQCVDVCGSDRLAGARGYGVGFAVCGLGFLDLCVPCRPEVEARALGGVVLETKLGGLGGPLAGGGGGAGG